MRRESRGGRALLAGVVVALLAQTLFRRFLLDAVLLDALLLGARGRRLRLPPAEQTPRL